MSVELKVLERAIAAKDFGFIARKMAEKAREMGWSEEDIARLAERLVGQCRR